MNSTEHFSESELSCRCCKKSGMDPGFLRKLEMLRATFGRPMLITSAYRCPEHNASVGEGKLVGAHTLGMAVDVAVSGVDAFALLRTALGLGFTGVGVKQRGSERYLHLDAVPIGRIDIPRPAIWSYP